MASLIFSGWAQPADALRVLDADAELFDYSVYPNTNAAFAELKKFKHVKRVIGWSLGGHLAVQAIAAGVLAPEHLTLIATPYQFVGDAAVKGMDPLTFDQFRDNYQTNPARTKTRFHALVAKGDARAAQVLEQLTHHPEVENTARWLPWLEYLKTSRIPPITLPPTLLVHGLGDAVVPPAQTEIWGRLPEVWVSFWQDAGHAPHLHDAAKLCAQIEAHRERKAAA